MIEEFRFGLDFNSPAFLSGVPKGKKKIEYFQRRNEPAPPKTVDYFPVDERGIRIPSLRGVLEFWYRALQGDAASSKEVYDRQAKIFGSADGGQGLRIRPAGVPKFEPTNSPGELRFGGRGEDPAPFLYLGYGPLQRLLLRDGPRDVEGHPFATSYHTRGARDVVHVSDNSRHRFQFAARGTREQIEALKRILILLHLFGGLGSRSRRGWGSVEVKAPGIELPKGDITPAKWIGSNLASVWTSSQYPAGKGEPAFSAFSLGTRIYVTKLIDSDYRGVLDAFYNRFKAVRSYQNGTVGVADYQQELGDLHGSSITKAPARLAFGMPFQPGKNWTMDYRGTPRDRDATNRDVNRRASPLLLKVVRLGPKSHFGVALFLRSSFFGDPDLEIGVVGRTGTQPFPGYGAIEQFLSGSGWTEVKLP